MTLSWEEFKKQKQEEYGIEPLEIQTLPIPRYREPRELPPKPLGRLFNIHKRSFPVGLDTVVMSNIESREIAERIIRNTTNGKGEPILQPKVHTDNEDNLKVCIFHEPIPADATLEEKSPYFNPKKLTTEPLEGYPERTA